MVGEDIDYVVVESDHTGTTERYVIAESRLASYARELGRRRRRSSARHTGADLVGLTYTPPFAYYLGHENAFRVVAAEFVTTDRRHRAGAHRRRLR